MKEWKALVAASKKARKSWEDGLTHTPESVKPLAQWVLDSLKGEEPPALDPERYGAMLALVAPQAAYREPNRFEEISALLVALGLDFALRVTVASTRFRHLSGAHISNYTHDLGWLDDAGLDDDLTIDAWIGLRAAIRDAAPADRKRALRVALELRDQATPSVRFALAWAFPDEPALFTDEDRRHGLVCDEDPGTIYDLAWMRDAKTTASLAKEGWGVSGLFEVDEIAEHLGKNALPALRRYVTHQAWDRDDKAVDHIAKIGGVPALRILAEAAHQEKTVLPQLVEAARNDPSSAVIAIATLLAEPPKKKNARRASQSRPLWRPILETVLAGALQQEPAARAKLDAAARAIADEVAPPLEKAKLATELPAALAVPPWAAPQKSPKPAAKGEKKKIAPQRPPKTIAYEERLDWGERDPKALFEVDGADEKKELKRIAQERATGETFFMLSFMRVKDATALRLVTEIPVSAWYGNVDDIEGMLARFGLAVLDPMLAYAKRQTDRFGAFLSVDSPRVAALAAHLYVNSKKTSDVAATWLAKYPRAAATGLVAALGTEKGKPKEAIEKALAFVKTKDPKAVSSVLEAAGATELVEQASSEAASKPIKAPKLPPFVDVDRLPRPRTKDGAALSADATRDLVSILALSERKAPRKELAALAEALDPASLDRLAWSLFVAWLAAGGPTKHAFGLDVLGYFGSPATLRVLAEAARAWAPGGLPQRAQAAVDVLALAKNKAGLAGIHRLTQVQSRALAKHAETTLAREAAARGIGKDDLVDQLVPDLGLEADGSLHFDFGSRSFALAFDEKMAPLVIDARGKHLADLPKPAPEEEEVAGSAVAQWKEIKKKSKEIVRAQTRRLEIALATERRFSVDHFETSFARHPLLQHLARRLVWGAYRGDALAFAFRVAEDGSYASLGDDTTRLERDLSIGLVHPLRLPAADVRAWGKRLFDYAIIQPFEQLARTTHAVKDAARLDHVNGKTVSTGKVLGLDRLGWARMDAIQGGRVHAWQKEARGHCAILPLDPGIYLGSPMDDPKQTLGAVEVARSADAPMDPVFYSELVRDLESLIAD